MLSASEILVPVIVVAFTVPPDWLVAVVAVVAFPDVFWLPEVFTPGRSILAVPSKETPPMVLAVARAVAVDAFPDTGPEIVVAVKAPTLAEP